MFIELLNCPFCDSPAEWSHNADGWYDKQPPYNGDSILRVTKWQSSIHCTGCRLPHCSGFGRVAWEGGNALAQQYAMRQAAKHWNNRKGMNREFSAFLEYWVIPHMERARKGAFEMGNKDADGYLTVKQKAEEILKRLKG